MFAHSLSYSVLRKWKYSCCNETWLTQLYVVKVLCVESQRVVQPFIIRSLVHLSWNKMKTSNGRRLQSVLVSFSFITVESVEFPLKIWFGLILASFARPSYIWQWRLPRLTFLRVSFLLFSCMQDVFIQTSEALWVFLKQVKHPESGIPQILERYLRWTFEEMAAVQPWQNPSWWCIHPEDESKVLVSPAEIQLFIHFSIWYRVRVLT